MKMISMLVAALVCCMVAMIPACASNSEPMDGFPVPEVSGGNETFTPVLAPESSEGKAVIMFPRYTNQGTYEVVLDRLNTSLEEKGLMVEFVLENNSFTSRDDTGSYLTKVNNELASGDTTADAYGVFHWNMRFVENAPRMDLTGILPVVSPAYYEKCKEVLSQDDKITGLPMGINRYTYRVQPAFMLRKDYEEQWNPEIKSVGDVIDIIESRIVAEKKVCSILVDPHGLLVLWVLEQGYYLLGSNYGAGRICAKIDDPECVPVLLEKIPGFYDFIAKIDELYKKGYLVYPDWPTNGWDNIGIIRDISEYYVSDPWNMYTWVTGEFVAHELNAALPSYYTSSSTYNSQLLIPQNNSKAAEIIKFADWLYSAQENYTMVVYGQEGVDVRIADGRYYILKDSEPAVFKTRDEMNGTFISWPGVQYMSCSDYSLLPSNSPINIEQIRDNGTGPRNQFPYDILLKNADVEGRKIVAPTEEMLAIIEDRDRLINEMVYSIFHGDYRLRMKPLDNLDNDWLLEEYKVRIAKLRESVKAN